MQHICLLLCSDLQLEVDRNPLADTHTRVGSLSIHCIEMKCEECDSRVVKSFACMNVAVMNYMQEIYEESDHNTIHVSLS